MRQYKWLLGLIVGCLIPIIAYFLLRTTQPRLTGAEMAFSQREKAEPHDMELIVDLEKRPLSYPVGRQTFDYIKVTDEEWGRLIRICETDNLLRVRAAGAVCFCEKQSGAARREEALSLAHRLLKKDNDFDPWNGLKIMERYKDPDWRAELERQKNSKHELVRKYVDQKLGQDAAL